MEPTTFGTIASYVAIIVLLALTAWVVWGMYKGGFFRKS